MKTWRIWQRPGFWAAFILTVLFATFMAAGTWQVLRARYKDGLQAELAQRGEEPVRTVSAELLDADTINLRPVQAQGQWLAEKTILLDNKVQDGIVGYEVLTPLRLDGNTYVLVNRGWVKAPPLRSELPQIATPTTNRTLSGIARVPSGHFIELGKQNITGMVWQNLTMARYAEWSGLRLQPFVIYQSESRDGLIAVLPAPEAMGINADRHRGYALTWYLLALVTLVLGLLTWYRTKGKA